MLEKISEFLSAINRVPVLLLVALGAADAFILFIPEPLAAILAVDEFRKTYRIYLGPGLVVVGAWLLARLLATVATPLKQRRNLRNLQNSLATLTAQEKGYLAEFMETGRTTILVPLEDGIIGSLVARKIAYRASNVFDVVEGVPYSLQPWARQYLQANPHVLEGAAGRPLSPRERARAERW